jgi:alkanesulfonate monooxygenase SsuD/methylene tetrahydromethanopterin reductase-like flavin-dependent oxidoreductase (luciferase family)
MRFAVWLDAALPWPELLAAACHADATGWDGVYLADHLLDVGFGVGPPGECWTSLGGLAARTSRVRLGPLVTCVSYRHPALIANMAATVDRISSGRFVLGVGSGWSDLEHNAFGFAVAHGKDRSARLGEACAVIRSLLRGDRVSSEGAFYSLTDICISPRPTQTALPILVGGAGALARSVAARYADEWNMWGLPEHCRSAVRRVEDRCLEIGRPPSELTFSAQALFSRPNEPLLPAWTASGAPRAVLEHVDEIADVIQAYHDAGVNEVVVPTFEIDGRQRLIDFLDWFQAGVWRSGLHSVTPALP